MAVSKSINFQSSLLAITGFFAAILVLFSIGCGQETPNNTNSGQADSTEPLGLALGITPRDEPYTSFLGTGRFSFGGGASSFNSNLKTMAGVQVATSEGNLRLQEGEVFELDCKINAKQPIPFQILGASSIDSDLPFDEDGIAQLDAGKHEIKASIVFEYVYEY